MALAPGTRLGPFEVVELLGAGGMGEVYRAHDATLQRDIAIKVLPDAARLDPDRIARFRREARVLATLNHPSIAAIYGFEESGGVPAIVLELVEGRTLSERLLRGPLPVKEALRVCRYIAEAAESAHEKGIVHRDLKPANVKVTNTGTVKVLDFGLAKAFEESTPDHSAPEETVSVQTRVGTVVGTAAYMSPEQARGQPIDGRTDIWALGCVLYESLTGRSAFGRATASDTIAAILTADPDWSALPAQTPDSIRRLLARCLQKDLDRRLHNMADVRMVLEDELAASPSGISQALNVSAARRLWKPALWLALAVMVAGIAWVMVGRLFNPSTPVREARSTRLTDRAGLEEFPALSPDGRTVAFTAGVAGNRQLFVQLITGGAPLQLTHDAADHELARWFPDSGSIVYFTPGAAGESQGTVWQIAALGGQPLRIANSLGGADISRVDGRLVFFRLADKGIELVTTPRDGSSASVVSTFPAVTYYLYPRWSPDGKWIAFQRGDSIRFDVFVVPSAGGEARQLTRDNNMMSGFAWLPDSSGLIYSSSRGSTMPYLPTQSLWQIGLSGGMPRLVASSESSYVNPDLGPNGTIVVGRMRLQTDIWKFPVDGSPADNVRRGVRLTRQTGQILTPTAGPGDREVAYLSDRGGHANVWVLDTTTGESRQITHEPDPDVSLGVPVWSPDGSAIAFLSTRGNPGLTFGIWLVNPDGSNLRSLVNPGLGPAWSSDGRWLYYSTRGSVGEVVMRKIPPEGGTPVTVSTERLRNVVGSDRTTVYYTFERPLVDGRPDFEIRASSPEDAPFRVLSRISASRVPIWQIVNPSLSPDGSLLAQALTDRSTTNIWTLSTTTGQWRQVTDFGDRTTFIARRVSWSSDGRFILAAVGEGDADIVRLDGFLSGQN
jgi:Tol biopolymer transport system component